MEISLRLFKRSTTLGVHKREAFENESERKQQNWQFKVCILKYDNKICSFNTALEGMTQRVTLETTKLVVWGLQRKTRSFKSALEGVSQGYTGSKMEKV